MRALSLIALMTVSLIAQNPPPMEDAQLISLRSKAELGDAKAQHDLAYRFMDGRGVAKNLPEAARWFRKAAELGYAPAQANLGICYGQGLGVARNDLEAIKWHRKAAEGGNALAQNNLGTCYDIGLGIAQDSAEGVRWYRKAAEQGLPLAQLNLAICYSVGKGVAKDAGEAAKWLRKAAEQGNAAAQNNLGACYGSGAGVSKDEGEAVRWYFAAAKQGMAMAQANLATCYANGQGVAKDDAQAMLWFRKAGDQGDLAAQGNLFRFLQFYSAKGDLKARWEMATCLIAGRGVAANPAEGIRILEIGNDANETEAVVRLGQCYLVGHGVQKDPQHAVELFQKAANEGHLGMQLEMANRCEKGLDTRKDAGNALHFYREAANQGSAEGEWQLARCYAQGVGTGPDPYSAYIYAVLAIANGEPRAKELRDQLAARLTAADREMAEARVADSVDVTNAHIAAGEHVRLALLTPGPKTKALLDQREMRVKQDKQAEENRALKNKLALVRNAKVYDGDFIINIYALLGHFSVDPTDLKLKADLGAIITHITSMDLYFDLMTSYGPALLGPAESDRLLKSREPQLRSDTLEAGRRFLAAEILRSQRSAQLIKSGRRLEGTDPEVMAFDQWGKTVHHPAGARWSSHMSAYIKRFGSGPFLAMCKANGLVNHPGFP